MLIKLSRQFREHVAAVTVVVAFVNVILSCCARLQLQQQCREVKSKFGAGRGQHDFFHSPSPPTSPLNISRGCLDVNVIKLALSSIPATSIWSSMISHDSMQTGQRASAKAHEPTRKPPGPSKPYTIVALPCSSRSLEKYSCCVRYLDNNTFSTPPFIHQLKPSNPCTLHTDPADTLNILLLPASTRRRTSSNREVLIRM